MTPSAQQLLAIGRLPQDRRAALRQVCDEVVGTMLFGQMLQQARQSRLNSGLFDSPAQRVWRQQMDSTLLERSANRLGAGAVSDAIYRKLSASMPVTSRSDAAGRAGSASGAAAFGAGLNDIPAAGDPPTVPAVRMDLRG